MQALEEGLHVAAGAEGSSRTVSAPPASEQHQFSRLVETSTRGVVSLVTAGQEVSELYSAKLRQISKFPSHAKMQKVCTTYILYWFFFSPVSQTSSTEEIVRDSAVGARHAERDLSYE